MWRLGKSGQIKGYFLIPLVTESFQWENSLRAWKSLLYIFLIWRNYALAYFSKIFTILASPKKKFSTKTSILIICCILRFFGEIPLHKKTVWGNLFVGLLSRYKWIIVLWMGLYSVWLGLLLCRSYGHKINPPWNTMREDGGVQRKYNH